MSEYKSARSEASTHTIGRTATPASSTAGRMMTPSSSRVSPIRSRCRQILLDESVPQPEGWTIETHLARQHNLIDFRVSSINYWLTDIDSTARVLRQKIKLLTDYCDDLEHFHHHNTEKMVWSVPLGVMAIDADDAALKNMVAEVEDKAQEAHEIVQQVPITNATHQ